MQSPNRCSYFAANMNLRRSVAAAIALSLCAALGACSPGYVADRWPRWAGGMPDDVPPRPGAPGYDEFIAHGQAGQSTNTSTAPGEKTTAIEKPAIIAKPAAGAVKTSVRPEPVPSAEPSEDVPAEDTSVVKGGLY
jgi:hypothetical protein